MKKMFLLLLALLTAAPQGASAFPYSFWKSGAVIPGDANTQLLLAFDNGLTIDDYGINNIDSGWAIGGAGTINGVQAKFGAGAWNAGEVATSGNSYLFHANHSAFRLGAGDFTIDYWVFSPGYEFIDHCSLSNASAGDWAIASYLGTVRFNNIGGVGELVSVPIPSTNAWHHVAVTRCSGTLKMCMDGTCTAGVANSTNFNNTTADIRIGAVGNFMASTNAFIDELRISDVCRWSGNFTPPTVPY